MPIPCPATPEEEEEQLAEALAKSLTLEPAAASAGPDDAVGDGASVHAAADAPRAKGEPAAKAPAQPAPRHGAVEEVERDAIAGRPSTEFRFYVCWRLPLHPHVCGVVASAEPAAWQRFAHACLGRSSAAGSGADFCGGRRTPTLSEAERVFLSRWSRSGGAPTLRIYRVL